MSSPCNLANRGAWAVYDAKPEPFFYFWKDLDRAFKPRSATAKASWVQVRHAVVSHLV